MSDPHRKRAAFRPVAVALVLTGHDATAFVSAPVGGHAGEVDAHARVTLERGGVEPHADAKSYQSADWATYQVGAGYTIGDVAFLRDLHVGVDASYFAAPAEVNDPVRGGVPPPSCLGVVLDASRCQFHPADHGTLVTPRIAFNLFHDGTTAFGLYVQGTIPFGLDGERFVLPRLDYFAGGVTFGTRLTAWLSFESNTYLGTGLLRASQENGTVAQTALLGFEAERWLLPWKVGIKAGTYFDGDLSDRFDVRYDAAYTTGYPAKRERIRAMRFGIALLPYVQVTEHLALDLGYVQKMFGYDAISTKTFYVGVRAAF